MAKQKTSYKKFEAELLKNPDIRREYEALKPKYDIVNSIIERRNKLKISQTQLAKIVGTKQPAISRLEKGNANVTLGTFYKVTTALGLDIILADSEKATAAECKSRA
jgi:DNA-binding XRE family transcriptional regulator